MIGLSGIFTASGLQFIIVVVLGKYRDQVGKRGSAEVNEMVEAFGLDALGEPNDSGTKIGRANGGVS